MVKVNDDTNNPLPGVSILVKETSTGAQTDLNGVANIKANGTDELIIQSLGFEKQTVNVENRSVIEITMKASSVQLSDVVVVGTRTPGRIKTETPVPVDIINVGQIAAPSGRTDVTSMLNYAAPSLNYNKQSGSDGADHIDLATLRGLGPDQTLVLINGKRRHQTAFVSVFGTRGRGNSGTDLNAIPVSAIDHIEILRDGASAQYGSDAIAGVINIVLKKSVNQFNAEAGVRGYQDKDFNPAYDKEFGQYEYGDGHKIDGRAISFNTNFGVPLGKKEGYFDLSLNYFGQGKTFRQVLDTTNFLTDEDALPVNPYRRANGDGSTHAVGTMYNLETSLAGESRIYSFGGFNYSSNDAFAFTRNFSARPDRFVTDADSMPVPVEGVIHTTSDGDTYYNPHIQTHISDASFAVGVKGGSPKSMAWDVSNTWGMNNFHFFGDKTFNASLNNPNVQHFDDGGFSFTQNTSDLNLSRKFDNGLNLAAGAEYRVELYQLYAGQPESYRNYDTSGYKATGAQGFPGYQPADVVGAHRSTVGAYIDAEYDVTDKWLVTAAARGENYSDFGFTANGKVSTRYKIADNLSVRASGSTGFRAPSLQQINFSSTFTTVQGGLVAEVKIAPNYSPITKAAGIPELNEEKSVNVGGGISYSPIRNLNVTVDGYMVKVKDRVVLSGQFDASDPTLDQEFRDALNEFSAAYAQFFANAVNTSNTGVDIVVEYKKVTEKRSFRGSLAGNVQDMKIDKINVPAKLNDTESHRQTFLSDREQAFILASAPKMKFAMNAEYGGKLMLGARATYFGEVTLLGYGEDALGINPQVPSDFEAGVYYPDKYVYSGKVVTDVYLSYKFSKGVKFSLGSDNILGVHPDLAAVKGAKYWAFNNEPAGPWDAVQMGGNGRRYFVKLGVNF